MSYSLNKVKSLLITSAAELALAKEDLERIDSESGDGDLGISMSKAADAIKNTVDGFPEGQDDIGRLFSKCAMAVNGAAPSTMGTLLSAGLMQLGKNYSRRDRLEMEDIVKIPRIFAEAIMQRGKAAEGDRTVLDALLPVSRVFEGDENQSAPLEVVLDRAAEAARDGMERTKTMTPRVGRARWTPENANGHPDGGAYLCWIIMEGFRKKKETGE